ncbi:hypothetical protein [Streptomyces sp. NBC_00996]|uniref:hypothetical protein n=1 Tax=Streptomyces sp. NBC_00996 TaxID=2903710 RepID=UPI0038646554|nr:hypothetical protein OG390_17265 [Streptomyces sp. NBC_00996]
MTVGLLISRDLVAGLALDQVADLISARIIGQHDQDEHTIVLRVVDPHAPPGATRMEPVLTTGPHGTPLVERIDYYRADGTRITAQ